MKVILLLLLDGWPVSAGQAVIDRLHTYDLFACDVDARPTEAGLEVDCRLRLLVRRPASASARLAGAGLDAELSTGDILDENSLAPACAGMDAVVHLVGIISEYGRQTFENIHAKGTRNLIAASQGQGVRRFVHVSALGTRPSRLIA